MKKTVLQRYELTDKNEAVIDVSVPSVEQLYHNFDKTAPYFRKELDEEFVIYMTECVQEIGKHPFIIRISLESLPTGDVMQRVQNSINSYYVYLKEIETRSMNRVFKRFITLFMVGLGLLVLAILASRRLVHDRGVTAEVFAQGLTIASWISIWEATVNIFFEWKPRWENIVLYNRIINASVVFRQLPQPLIHQINHSNKS